MLPKPTRRTRTVCCRNREVPETGTLRGVGGEAFLPYPILVYVACLRALALEGKTSHAEEEQKAARRLWNGGEGDCATGAQRRKLFWLVAHLHSQIKNGTIFVNREWRR